MNKSELLENYTAEQLAEMVVEQEEENQKLYNEAKKWQKEAEQHRKVYQTICHLEDLESESVRLKSEIEKYRKAFEDAKKERDCQIAEYQKKIDELEKQLDRSQTIITQIDEIFEELFGVKHDSVEYGEFEEFLREKVMEKVSDFLPSEPIKAADMLISAVGEYEHNPIAKAICGTDKGTYRIFDISELRQIAEHLLVYCNANWRGENEE